MSLAHRVIPTVLCRGRELVKGQQFRAWRSVGVAAQAVQVHAAREVDEVCLLDIAATPEHRGPDIALVKELSEALFAPLTVGGGVKCVEDVRALLLAGADKVVVCTAALEEPELISAITAAVGSQALTVAIDVRRGNAVYSHCGQRNRDLNPVHWAKQCERLGAGEILLTAVEREGTLAGYDQVLVSMVSRAVNIPVIAHGGCSGYADMIHAIRNGASAVAAGALFQFTECTPRGAAEYLKAQGLEARV